MSRKKLLFLNPPGQRTCLRDYFCSKVSQADYINHPIDFVFLSGFFKDEYDLHLIDAVVDGLGEAACLAEVHEVAPHVVVGLIGSVSYLADVPFYRKLSEALDTRLILIGDILIDRREQRLKDLFFVDAFLHDFSTDDLSKYLQGEADGPDEVKNMTVRHDGGVHPLAIKRSEGQLFSLPIPEHRLFLRKNYRYPFVRDSRFATVMTDFGCPYHCTFCVMSTLGWKLRPVDNVVEELQGLASMGIRELLFLNQTFGIPREGTRRLLDEMSQLPHPFHWVCFSRPDVLDEELLDRMKSSGCHTVILGMESGSQGILDSVRKDYSKEQVLAGFRLCARQGVRTVATVLLGLPGETEETFRETLDFLREVNPDFASFNVAVPRMGTPFRQEALDLGLIDENLEIMDQSGSPVAMPTLTLDREQIASMRGRAIREFYFRFGYLRKCVRRLRPLDKMTVSQIRIQFGQGYHLLRNYFFA